MSAIRISVVLSVLLSITACGGGGGSNPNTGTNNPPPSTVSTVELSPGTVSISSLGSTVQFVASAKDSGGNVVANTTFDWSSSNANIATVNSIGAVSSVGNGTATISAAAGNGVSGSANVTIQQIATAFQASTTSVAFSALGQGQQIDVDATDANGNSIVNPAITWSSTDKDVATVSASGLVSAQGNGSATISAAIDGLVSNVAATVEQVVTKVQANPSSVAFTAFGNIQPISAIAFDANDNAVIGETFGWSSSDDTVSFVDASGVVTATGNGAATVTAAAGNGIVAVAVINVQQVASTVQLTPPSLSFSAFGDSQQLVADAFDANGNGVSNVSYAWSSTDDSVSTVTTSGLVTSLGNGSVAISANIAGAAVGNAAVVVAQVASSIQVTPNFATHERIGESRQYQLAAFDVNGFAIAQPSVVWSVDNQLVAEVSTTGIAITTGFGLTNISATVDSEIVTATMRVSFGSPMSLLPEDWSVPIGETIGFTARLSESGEPPLVWSVNGTPTGNATVGVIDSSGLYSAPAAIPAPVTITVRAALASDPSVFVESPVTVTGPSGAVRFSRTDWTPRVLDFGVDEDALFELSISGYPGQLDFDRPTANCPNFCPGSIGAELVPVRTGIYALRFASIELLKDYTPGNLREYVGSIECLTCAQAGTAVFDVNVRDQTVPAASITPIAADVQASSHLVNVQIDSYGPDSSAIPRTETTTFYSHFPDSFHFLSVIREADFFRNRIYNRVRNQISGLGLPILDQSGGTGSAAMLEGVIVFPFSVGFDGASRVMSHEIGHRWGVYLDNLPPLQGGPHWPATDLATGVMGYGFGGVPLNISFVPVSGNIYEVVSAMPTGEYSDMQLYLMGLIGPQEVLPHPFLDDLSMAQIGNQLAASVFSIDDITAANGVRSPDYLLAPNSFSMATIILSHQRLLTDVEMSFFNHMAVRAEETAEQFVHDRFTEGFEKPFFLATGRRATISTRVLP